MRGTQSVRLGGWLLPLVGLGGVGGMSIVEGGLLSEAMYWMPFIPLIAVLTTGPRGVWTLGLLVLAVLTGLLLLPHGLREPADAGGQALSLPEASRREKRFETPLGDSDSDLPRSNCSLSAWLRRIPWLSDASR